MALAFQKKLVLNQWMLGLFECDTLEALAGALKGDARSSETLEGYDDGISRFHIALVNTFKPQKISREELLVYDQNILTHTDKMNEKRHGQDKIRWKYFQYLALLFAEIYLDRYFRAGGDLLDALNARLDDFNAAQADADRLSPFTADELRRIAFFQATGSGKTLLMHINIMQYQHYLEKSGRRAELNRIILLTPNEGLSAQHLSEFRKSGLRAKLFDKNSSSGLFTDQIIEIIDVHKLGDKMGEKTVDVAAFEDNNLVLVDEGHRGSSGEEWMKRRNQLSKNGFSFEYSATFEQAIAASNDRQLEQQYAKAILFNYSYKYFYGDGFGKDYKILNLDETNNDEATRQLYLTACMLSFYQQTRFFQDQPAAAKKYNLEKPLLVLVGARVNVGGQHISDLEEFLQFLARFVGNSAATRADIATIMKGEHGLYVGGRDVFDGAFAYLHSLRISPADMLADIKQRVFNSDGGAFIIEHLKGSGGEIALRLGDSEQPFGIINVGNPKKLVDKCREHEGLFEVSTREFSQSYFRKINEVDSDINILIGAKKFTEGWSSWRVSTMGLLKVGQSEGSQIIQLFGRGVRLKGIDLSLKRSSESREGAPTRAPMKYIKQLETLNIFGVQAGYMAQFRDFLIKEDVAVSNEMIDITLPIRCDYDEAIGLKIIDLDLDEDMTYKKVGPRPIIGEVGQKTKVSKIILNWYPKLQGLSSANAPDANPINPQTAVFNKKHLGLLDMNRIFFDMQAHKNLRRLYNINISRHHIRALLLGDWYSIEIPPDRMEFSDDLTADIARWQEIASRLMCKYIDRTHSSQRTKWEHKHLEYKKLERHSDNMLWNAENGQHEYTVSIKADREDIEDIKDEIKALGEDIGKWKLDENGHFAPVVPRKFDLLSLVEHLYQPLIHLQQGAEHIKIKPTALNDGEQDLVKDLQKYIDDEPALIKSKDLYLLRNQSKGKGIGFFDEARFYPDFVLWIVDGVRQYISFIDPHGLRNTNKNDPKIRLHKTIKDTQKELADKNIALASFVLSRTAQGEGSWVDDYSKEYFEARNVFFQTDPKADYIQKIIEKSLEQANT